MSAVNIKINRSVTLQGDDGKTVQISVEELRGYPAYVLLGDPGSGKTTVFKAEATAVHGRFVDARDFLTLSSASFEGQAPLFIDGLDEMRAGGADERQPLDLIRAKLGELGNPPYRLSCREADWLGEADRSRLQRLHPEYSLTVVHLDQLDDTQIRELLSGFGVRDAQKFVEQAEDQRVGDLLKNPLLLRLLATAMAMGDRWPSTRSKLYELACSKLAVEVNTEHLIARRKVKQNVESIIADAGSICAVLLLAGFVGIGDDSLEEVLVGLGIGELEGLVSPSAARQVVATNLFKFDHSNKTWGPIHRTIGEYLAGKALATAIETRGLPVGRVLALMTGDDGGIVQPLRGLHAWLAAHCQSIRGRLIEADPLGVILYGDVRDFSPAEKERALLCLENEAKKYPWFRNQDWVSSPFGALATDDMAPVFRRILLSSDRSNTQHALVDCVLDTLFHGQPVRAVETTLDEIVRSPSFFLAARRKAVEIWIRYKGAGSPEPLALLSKIGQDDSISRDLEVIGQLLTSLYPDKLSPIDALGYLYSTDADAMVGTYQLFWDLYWIDRMPREWVLPVADYCAKEGPFEKLKWRWDSEPKRIIGRLIARAFFEGGDGASDEQRAAWLNLGSDEYGFVRLEEDERKQVAEWFDARPHVQLSILRLLLQSVDVNAEYAWANLRLSEQKLMRSRRPDGMGRWYLDLAGVATSETLAEHCFQQASAALIEQGVASGISIEDLERWPALRREEFPKGADWLHRELVCELDESWQAKSARQARDYQAQFALRKARWVAKFREHIDSIETGQAPAGLLYELGLAYQGLLMEARGDTPMERMGAFLNDEGDLINAAMRGMEASLFRGDLPTVEDILDLDIQGKMHYIRPACLVGAAIVAERDSSACLSWPIPLQQRLVAFWLADGTGDMPRWFRTLVSQRPNVVVDVLVSHVAAHLQKKPTYIAGLWQLAKDEDFHAVAPFAVPKIVRAFPVRASAEQLNHLPDLIVAAFKSMPVPDILAEVARRTRLKTIDLGQRIQWLFVGLLLEPSLYREEFVASIGGSELNAYQVGQLLNRRGEVLNWMSDIDPVTLAVCLEAVGVHASPEWPTSGGFVSTRDELRDSVRAMIGYLEGSSDPEAEEQLRRLSEVPALKHWHLYLQSSIYNQQAARRNSGFAHCDSRAVVQVMLNAKPANSADLTALVVAQLEDLDRYIRGGDAGELASFWRKDGKGQKPKIENDCRDAILFRLREPLRQRGVDLGKEAPQWKETRVDLRASALVAGRKSAVPIELKGEWNDELWSAPSTQLARYARHPEHSNFGVYVALWFYGKTTESPDGRKPSTPSELREMLIEMIPEDQRERLRVVVLNCSLDD